MAEGLTREDLDAKERQWQQELEEAKATAHRVVGALSALRILKELLDEKSKSEEK